MVAPKKYESDDDSAEVTITSARFFQSNTNLITAIRISPQLNRNQFFHQNGYIPREM